MHRASTQSGIRCLITILGLLALVAVIGCGRDEEPPASFAIEDNIDPHVRSLANRLLQNEEDPLAWAGNTLLPQEYTGAMRSPSGVATRFMGNQLDRCVMVRHLLSAYDIPSRYALEGEACTVEALHDGEVKYVQTARGLPQTVPDSYQRTTELPDSIMHKVQVVEQVWTSQSDAAPQEHLLGTVTTHLISSRPVTADFVDQGGRTRLRLRIGLKDDSDRIEWHGSALQGVSRHDLVFRHVQRDGTSNDHRRTLFDTSSRYANQEPDAGLDVYAIWIGTNALGPEYLRTEADTLGQTPGAESGRGVNLRLRAIELAIETDHAAWQLFQRADAGGAALFDSLRIIIAAKEKRFTDSSVIIPSLDLVANTRVIVDSDQPATMQFALGLSDATVEGTVLERATGQPVITVPTIFAELYQVEANDSVSRVDFYTEALERFTRQGYSGDRMVFSDPVSSAESTVIHSGNDLVLELSPDQKADLSTGISGLLETLEETSDGIVLSNDLDRALPIIDLVLFRQGARADFTPGVVLVPGTLGELSTPAGSFIHGSGTYLDQEFEFHSFVRAFESADLGDDSGARMDYVDWHRTNADGRIIGSGTSVYPSASLDERKPRLLQWGEDRVSSPYYQSPMWLAPSVVNSIRNNTPTEVRFVYQKDPESLTTYSVVRLTDFAADSFLVTMDGRRMEVRVVVASDEEGRHQIAISPQSPSRLALRVKTPVGESQVDTIRTPAPLRIQGRVVSHREVATPRGPLHLETGLANARVQGKGFDTETWPDGTFTAFLSNTAQPTLSGSVAVLVDTSGSMKESVDEGCDDSDCVSKLDVVVTALEENLATAPTGIEVAVWGFTNNYSSACGAELNVIEPLSLDRSSSSQVGRRLGLGNLTRGTPLTGAVEAALERLATQAHGGKRRLVVLADGDNDCDVPLRDVAVPEGVEVHAIGVGLEEGSEAELELIDLARRGGGTYRRTSDGSELRTALSIIGDAELTGKRAGSLVEATVSAQGHLSSRVEIPVDDDLVELFLEEVPQRDDRPKFVVVLPGAPFPMGSVDIPEEAVARIEEERTRQPEIAIIVPDRAVSIGHAPEVVGWLEVDVSSGRTTARTIDGLRGAVAFLGGILHGMWGGTTAVLGGFSSCVLGPEGCGESLSEIRQTICFGTPQDASVWAEILEHLEGLIPTPEYFGYGVTAGTSVVQTACTGELQGPSTWYVFTEVLGTGVSSGSLNWAYSVWAQVMGLHLDSQSDPG